VVSLDTVELEVVDLEEELEAFLSRGLINSFPTQPSKLSSPFNSRQKWGGKSIKLLEREM